ADYSILYGSLGVGIALLVWMYMISLVVLVGAEFNAMLFPRARLGIELIGSNAHLRKPCADNGGASVQLGRNYSILLACGIESGECDGTRRFCALRSHWRGFAS